MKLIKFHEKCTYLHITLHKRVPNSRNLNQRREVHGGLPAVVQHALGCGVVGIIILTCSKMKVFEHHSVPKTSVELANSTHPREELRP